MANQIECAETFRSLHVKGDPIVLFNVWDAGTARVVEAAGAKAIATGSWSVAAAHGCGDGQVLSLTLAMENLARIVASVTLPVTIDLEAGYGEAPEVVGETGPATELYSELTVEAFAETVSPEHVEVECNHANRVRAISTPASRDAIINVDARSYAERIRPTCEHIGIGANADEHHRDDHVNARTCFKPRIRFADAALHTQCGRQPEGDVRPPWTFRESQFRGCVQ